MTKWIQAYMVEELNPHDDCAGTGRIWDFAAHHFAEVSPKLIRPTTFDQVEAAIVAAAEGGVVIP